MKIDWDDSDAKSAHANVFNITGTREEIVFFFGKSRSTHKEQTDVRLTNRIVLNPFAAKRLQLQLDHALWDHELRFGPSGAEAQSISQLALPGAADGRPATPAAEKNFRIAQYLFKQIQHLNVAFDFEHSFKMSFQKLLWDRFLIFLDKTDLGQVPHRKILYVCKQLDMPDDFRTIFKERLPQANPIDFGFEGGDKHCVYKVYLDFLSQWKKKAANHTDNLKPFLMFIGFKWNAQDNTQKALTKYTWHPSLAYEDIRLRLSNIFEKAKSSKGLELVIDLLGLIAGKTPHDKIYYLDVTEEHSPRRSFDLNAYSAEIQLEELYPLLKKIVRHYSIPADQFFNLYSPVKHKRFGHISGGIDRDGNDFLTIYFGLQPVVKDS
jgi:hypothetical protein